MKRMMMCAVILTLAVLCSACGAGSSSYERGMSSSAASDNAPLSEAEYYSEAAEYASPSDGVYGGEEAQSSLPLLTQNDDPGSMMVYNVGLELQTTTFDEGTRGLLTTVREMGGYVVGAQIFGRSLYEPGTERSARYTLRIPSEKLADFLVAMEDSYNLWRLDQQSQDIARQHTQTDLNLEYHREQETRLKETIERTEDEEIKADLERELQDVQAQIAASTATIGAMEKDVLYSTVTVQLYEVFEGRIPAAEEPAPTTFGGRLGSTANRSWDGFVSFCQGLLLVVVTLLPALAILAVVAVAALLIRHFLIKRGIIKPIDKNKKPGNPNE